MKLTDRFRPKADREVLSRLNNEAWQAKSDGLLKQLNEACGDRLVQHLESLYLPAEMEVLRKYGCARKSDSITAFVQATNSDRWDEYILVPLSRPVLLPDSYRGIYCGGPWFSDDPDRGLRPEQVAKIKAGEDDVVKSWEKFVADQDERERHRISRDLEPLFVEIADARIAYRKQYKAIMDMPKIWKTDRGEYPTWAEIAEHFPVFGSHIQQAV